jgi:2-desacetyl-2-hydroxyethyl bacteriochlorophyllide A dehydrogenase
MRIREVVVTGQNEVELQENEVEERELGAHEVLIDTEYSFISAGTELANYTGKTPQVFQPGSWCAYPWRSGYANVGMVRAVGVGVERVAPGQRVFSYGPHSSTHYYHQSRLVLPVPEGLDPAIAAASRMVGVATTALFVCEMGTNPWVAIYGLGAVGNLAAQAFRIRGCRVIGIDPVQARRELAQRCGIEHVLGGHRQEVEQAIKELTAGTMADIAIDAVGHSAVVMQALETTAKHGQLVLLGTPRVPVEGDLTELLAAVHLRFITIRGALEWSLPMYPDHSKGISQYSKQQMIFDWLARGDLLLQPLVSHRLPPEQIKTAYEGLLNETETYTGVVLEW